MGLDLSNPTAATKHIPQRGTFLQREQLEGPARKQEVAEAPASGWEVVAHRSAELSSTEREKLGLFDSGRQALHTVRGQAPDSGPRAALASVTTFLKEVNGSTFGRVMNGLGVPFHDAERFIERMSELLGLANLDFKEKEFFRENEGINAFTTVMLDEDPALCSAALQLAAGLHPLDVRYQDAIRAHRSDKGVTYKAPAGESTAGRDYTFADPSLTQISGHVGAHPADLLIDSARQSLPEAQRSDPKAILRACGKLLLLLHDDTKKASKGEPSAEVGEVFAQLPKQLSTVFSDWLLPMDVSPKATQQRGYLVERLRDVADGDIPSGAVRHGYYHLNAATAIYILAASDLGFAFRNLAPQVQKRMAAEYKTTTSPVYRQQNGAVGEAVYEALRELKPGLYAKAQRGNLDVSDVVGDGTAETDPLRRYLDDPRFLADVRARCPAGAELKEIEANLVNEQALLFHTARSVEMHGAGKQAALRLRARIERALGDL